MMSNSSWALMGMSSLAPKIRQLVDELRMLIELVDNLPASPQRAATVSDLIGYWDRLNAIIKQERVTLH
jgi:hypothetical protein